MPLAHRNTQPPLIDWFTQSLLPQVLHDVGMVCTTTKEKSNLCGQHLDLIYSQSGTLHDIIPNAPRISTNPPNHNLTTTLTILWGRSQLIL